VFRTSDLILIAVMMSAAAVTYHIKDRAEATEDHIARLRTQIQLEKDQMDVLKADWSLMTQPARLERVVQVYNEELGLKPVEAGQIMKIGDLPMAEPKLEPGPEEALGVASARADTTITTGGITTGGNAR
jgi:hypothetical protein